MTELFVTTIDMPTAPLGAGSPLPMLEPIVPIGDIAGDVPADIATRAHEGAPSSLLPYLAQDDYGRRLSPRPWRVAVLENDALRATVALDLGGRLLSLHDRRADRQLLYVNPVVQPANLALRNAWCSGGVEWNIGTRGHSPFTMDTLHTAVVEGVDGEPMLRLWEWERLRGVVFQVDVWLPSSSPVLLARSRVRNLNDIVTPMYWWTNAAISVTPETRVLAPAVRAFRTEYPNGLRVAGIPLDGGGDGVLSDVTFPSRHRSAADYFFDIESGRRPWIAAVNGDGSGVAHVSTAELRGRKLFVWGTGRGGRRWQQWLSHGGDDAYAEIQAGLAPTQFEHMMMPARAEWSWTEAFGAITVDARCTHGSDWGTAVGHAEVAIDNLVPVEQLDEWHLAAAAVADRSPATMLSTGSGWGALERRRRHEVGSNWFDETGTPFPESSVGPDQEAWQALLRSGRLPSQPSLHPPRSYVVGSDWEARLGAGPPSWLTDYLCGVMAHGRGDRRAAIGWYQSSVGREANAWAWRGLAEAARADGRPHESARYAVKAARLSPGEWRLAAEAVGRLLDDARPRQALDLLDELPRDVRNRSRIRLLEAYAAHGAGDDGRAQAILTDGLEVADLREGERSVDELWHAVFPDRPLPADYDFRMVERDPVHRSAASDE